MPDYEKLEKIIKAKTYKQKHVKLFTNLRVDDLDYLINFINNHTIRNDPPSFYKMFGDEFWRYLDFMNFCIREFYIPEDLHKISYTPKHFDHQLDEVYYIYRLYLSEKYNVDVNLTLPKMLADIVDKAEDKIGMFREIDDRMFNDYHKCSVLQLEFLHECKHISEYRKVPDNIPELINIIKTVDINELALFDYEAENYYKYITSPKIAAISAFLQNLDAVCELDDGDDITISKSSVKSLMAVPGVKDMFTL